MNKAVRTHSTVLISRYLPEATFTAVYAITPRLNPVAMLKVNGIATTVINAGNASVKSAHCTRAIDCIIKAPTRMSAGAVAKPGIAEAMGEQNIAARNNT